MMVIPRPILYRQLFVDLEENTCDNSVKSIAIVSQGVALCSATTVKGGLSPRLEYVDSVLRAFLMNSSMSRFIPGQ